MPLTPGTRLGPYDVQSAIGAGGMGEVWRAHDRKLGRDVALKILPDGFAHDPDRLARFEREARVLASLNHPHIAAIYGFEEADGIRALVLELVEGPTLADRIGHGPIPLDESLTIARQIAQALQAAHDHGVIHRDLKPSNIKLRTDGTVKVLDFGLAKALDPVSPAGDISQSPTLTSPAFTKVGVILGTAAYMSPEQALGKSVDKRADIWAFGVVLFEMLSGRRPFAGETPAEALASVVKDEPRWDECPATVRRLLRRCLQKDPKDRLHDIADAALLLEENPLDAAPVSITNRAVPWTLAAAGALTTAVALWAPWRTAPLPPESIRTQVQLPDNVNTAGRNFTLSPDGRKLAFSAVGSDGVARVWIRFMDSLEVRPLPGTETTPIAPPFFWSPDSRFVAYSATGAKLKKVDLVGSPPQTLCDTIGPNAPGGDWNSDGGILFGSVRGPLTRVDASGGATSAVTALDASRMETRHAFPTFLADGRRFLYLRSSSVPENSGVFIGSLDARPEEQDSRQLLATAFMPVYVPPADSGHGRLLIVREGNVLAYAFDEARKEIVGDPVTVVQKIGSFVGSAFYSASRTGVLVYNRAPPRRIRGFSGGPARGRTRRTPSNPAVSNRWPSRPTGRGQPWPVRTPRTRLGMSGRGKSREATARASRSTRGGPTLRINPDGNPIVFASNREGPWNLYRKRANKSKDDEQLSKSGQDKVPTSMSSDGRFLLYTQANPQTRNDIWVLSNPGGRRGRPDGLRRSFWTRHPTRATPFTPGSRGPVVAGPHWVAYVSDESGRNEVYVREFSRARRA